MARQPRKSKPPKRLFEDSDEENDTQLHVNKAFAEKYVERKKNEELSQLREKYGDEAVLDDEDEDEDSSAEEDETGELVTPDIDKQIMRTLAMIKGKDPRVYDPKQQFFSEEQLAKARQQWEEKQAKIKSAPKPMKLKDYERQQLLKGKVGIEEDDKHPNTRQLSYAEEQQQLKESFLKSTKELVEDDEQSDEDDDGNIFSVRKTSDQRNEQEEESYKAWLLEQQADEEKKNADEMAALRRYWTDPNLDPNEKFLRDYVLNRGWLEKNEGIPTYNQVVNDEVDDDEDAEQLEEMEDFEYKYNFRFEEPGGVQLQTFTRNLDDSVRRTDTKRREKRLSREERKKEEKQKKMAELQRLRELKKKEIVDKLHQIEEISGVKATGFEDVDFENDFDPEAHDRAMQQMFDEEYYSQEVDTEKPEFKEDYDEIFEDELIVNDDEYEENDEQQEEQPADEQYDDDGGWNGNGSEEWGADAEEDHAADDDNTHRLDSEIAALMKKKAMKKLTNRQRDRLLRLEKLRSKTKKRATKEVEEDPDKLAKRLVNAISNSETKNTDALPHKQDIDALLDEYYQLDYEDIVADQPTRFKYHQVEPSTFGLTIEEILFADDRDLNAHVSIKKLAPYRPAEVQQNEQRKYSKAKRVRLFREKLKEKQAFFNGENEQEEEDGHAKDENGSAVDERPQRVEQRQQQKKSFTATNPPHHKNAPNRATRIAAKSAGISAERLQSYHAGSMFKKRKQENSNSNTTPKSHKKAKTPVDKK